MGKIVCVCGFYGAVGHGDAILRETADILVTSDWPNFFLLKINNSGWQVEQIPGFASGHFDFDRFV